MSRPLWMVRLIKATFPQRFLAARLTRLPLLGSILNGWLFAGDDIIYLPKTRVIQVGQSVLPPTDTVVPSRIVEYFIERASVHWLMNTCICREASHCKDYPIDLGCLFLGEAAKKINPKLGRQVTREEALAHVRRCREAGLVHMVGRNKLDTVWLGVGPGSRLLTICNCCPCCCLWRILPDVADDIGRKVSRLPGVEVTVTDRCVGCGVCTQDVCFVDAIRLESGRALISDACRGCGRCVDACPYEAIELTYGRDTDIDGTIQRLAALVDVT